MEPRSGNRRWLKRRSVWAWLLTAESTDWPWKSVCHQLLPHSAAAAALVDGRSDSERFVSPAVWTSSSVSILSEEDRS